MKKIMMIMGLFSIVLFGADMQVVGLETKVLAPSDKTNALNIPKNAKHIKFKDQEPAQITLNVSVDVDPLELSALTEEERQKIKETVVQCYVYGEDDSNNGYTTELPLNGGQNNLKVKFNGISHEKFLYIDTYECFLAYKGVTGKIGLVIEVLPEKFFSKLVWFQTGSID